MILCELQSSTLHQRDYQTKELPETMQCYRSNCLRSKWPKWLPSTKIRCCKYNRIFPQTYHGLFQECKSESFASHFTMIQFGRLLNSILWMLFSRLTFVEISISFSRLWSHLKIDQVLNCLMLLLPASIFSKLAFIEPVKRVSWFSCRMTAIRHWISLDRIRSFYPQCSL